MFFTPDEQFWLGLGIGVLGIVITLGIAWYQRQVPELEVSFGVPGGSPAALTCRIRNHGRGQATDVVIAFSFMLPLQTRVHAQAEVLATLEEAELPPDPFRHPNVARVTRAFAVRIPRVPPRSAAEFEIRTSDPDNLRAAEQCLRIRQDMESILAEFGTRLAAADPVAAQRWNVRLIMEGRTKTDSFYKPQLLSYERGASQVSVLTQEEAEAAAYCQDLFTAFKQAFAEVFRGRPDHLAPVVRVKTLNGPGTYAVMPPFVSSHIDLNFPVAELKAAGRVFVYPAVPESYVPAPGPPENAA